MLKSLLIEASAGEIMDEEMGETRVKQDTMSVAAHLRLMDQFLGFAGSAGESHVTYACQPRVVDDLVLGYLQDSGP